MKYIGLVTICLLSMTSCQLLGNYGIGKSIGRGSQALVGEVAVLTAPNEQTQARGIAGIKRTSFGAIESKNIQAKEEEEVFSDIEPQSYAKKQLFINLEEGNNAGAIIKRSYWRDYTSSN